MGSKKPISKTASIIILMILLTVIAFLFIQAFTYYKETFASLSSDDFKQEEVSEYLKKTKESLTDFKEQINEGSNELKKQAEKAGKTTDIPDETLNALKEDLQNTYEVNQGQNTETLFSSVLIPFTFKIKPSYTLKEGEDFIKIEAIEKNFAILISKKAHDESLKSEEYPFVDVETKQASIILQDHDVFEMNHQLRLVLAFEDKDIYLDFEGVNIDKDIFNSSVKQFLETIRFVYE